VEELLESLNDLNPDELTPKAALDMLYALVTLSKKE
jgi:hypothetical protein